MGIVSGSWKPEIWKATLAHHGRIAHVCAEFAIAQDDEAIFPYDGNPFSAFEISFVLAAFCIRRLSEKRLLTDALDEKKWSFTSYPATDKVRRPFASQSGNAFYRGYQFDKQSTNTLTLKEFGHEVIHSSNLGIVTESEGPPIGIVVASDHRLIKRLIHIDLNRWSEMCRAVIDDHVYFASDNWDPDSGAITAKREGFETLERRSE